MQKFELKPSLYLTLLFLILHGGAIAIVLWIIPQNLLELIFVILCSCSLFYILAQQTMRFSHKAVVKFWLDASHNWNLQQRDGQISLGKLRGDSLCTLCFVLLNFQKESDKFSRSIMVCPDAMLADDFRQLRIILQKMRY